MSTDLARLANDPSALELAGDPGQFVVLACERAKQWLTEALNNGDIEQLVELKSQAEAIRIYTAQKQIGKDAELAAAEIVRRAERGIGVAIRRGQEAREIKRSERHGDHDETSISPMTYFGSAQERTDVYAVTDDVPDDQFEEAITEAKAEGNLSRANVVRKVKGETHKGPKNEWHRHRRNLDSNRIVRETILALEGNTSGLELIEFDKVVIEDWWIESLTSSLSTFRKLRDQLKGMTE